MLNHMLIEKIKLEKWLLDGIAATQHYLSNILIPVSDISIFQLLNLLLHVKFQAHIILVQMIYVTIPRAVNKNKFTLKSMRDSHVKFFNNNT